MNSESSHLDDGAPEGDERQLAEILRSLSADAPPPNSARLAELRQTTLKVFEEAAKISGSATNISSSDASNRSEPPAVTANQTPTVAASQPAHASPQPHPIEPTSSLRRLLVRGLAAVAATAALIAIGLTIAIHNSARGAGTFGDVVDQLGAAKSLQFRVAKNGESSEVVVRLPDRVRWDDAQGRYRIASGSRLWKIDEASNTVTSADFQPSTKDHKIDLVALLDAGVNDASGLLAARSSEEADYAGKKCAVYRAKLPAVKDQLNVAAYVDLQSKQLVGIVAQPVGIPVGIGPPRAELVLVAINPPVDESKFVIAKSLTEDGRIGKIIDAQGLVVLRPALAQRWTPVGREARLKPGDWLRTDIRGANAAKARLSSDVELTLGPGTFLQCVSPTQARLYTGELQVLPSRGEGASSNPVFELLAPHDASRKFDAAGKSLVRIDRNEKLVDVTETPKWLSGFEGTSAGESLGSLIVNLPDGRNEPLTIGYHKVNVEIRDQIARTTIEESFVNHTRERQEGVFYFPLPAEDRKSVV